MKAFKKEFVGNNEGIILFGQCLFPVANENK